MTNISTSPQPASATVNIAAQSIITNLASQIKGKDNAIALGIANCILHKTPAEKIIKEVKEMISHNETMMERLLGISLLTTIKNFSHV